jgi:methyl-accepting chemotaxis protein
MKPKHFMNVYGKSTVKIAIALEVKHSNIGQLQLNPIHQHNTIHQNPCRDGDLSRLLENISRLLENISRLLENISRLLENISRLLENISRLLENILRLLENISRLLETAVSFMPQSINTHKLITFS